MSEKTLILQNQRHKIFFRQERIKARSQRKESCLNEVKNLSKERVPLKDLVPPRLGPAVFHNPLISSTGIPVDLAICSAGIPSRFMFAAASFKPSARPFSIPSAIPD